MDSSGHGLRYDGEAPGYLGQDGYGRARARHLGRHLYRLGQVQIVDEILHGCVLVNGPYVADQAGLEVAAAALVQHLLLHAQVLLELLLMGLVVLGRLGGG